MCQCLVFALENNRDPVPMRVTKQKRGIHVNLLLIREWDDENDDDNDFDDEEEEDEWHYVLITDVIAVLASSSTRNKRLFWCESCLSPVDSEQKYTSHMERCTILTPQAIRMPTESQKYMKFTDFHKQVYHDYVIYYDFESILKASDKPAHESGRSGTTEVNTHVPSGFCYIVIGPDGKAIKPPVLYHGDSDVAKKNSAVPSGGGGRNHEASGAKVQYSHDTRG